MLLKSSVDLQASEKSAFVTPDHFFAVPFGLKNAPATFQRQFNDPIKPGEPQQLHKEKQPKESNSHNI